EHALRNGRVWGGYLGASLQASQTAGDGALVAEVSNGGPASRAGLRNGDRIVEFDGKPVKSTKQLTELIADTPSGTAVKLKFVRDGQEQTASITPAERPGRRVANSPEARDPYGRPPQP